MTSNHNFHIYSDCQHGFRKHRSCVTQLLEVMEDFTEIIDNKDTIDVIYLDYRKAFDTVPHERLILKIVIWYYRLCLELDKRFSE